MADNRCSEQHPGFSGGRCQVLSGEHEVRHGNLVLHKTNLGRPLEDGGWVWATRLTEGADR